MTQWAEKAAERAAERIAPPGFLNTPGIRAHYAGIIVDEVQRHHDAGCPRQAEQKLEKLRQDGGPLGGAVCMIDNALKDGTRDMAIFITREEGRALLAALTRNVPVIPASDADTFDADTVEDWAREIEEENCYDPKSGVAKQHRMEAATLRKCATLMRAAATPDSAICGKCGQWSGGGYTCLCPVIPSDAPEANND